MSLDGEVTFPIVLLTGGTGQVGAALRRTLEGSAHVLAPSHSELDLHDADALRRAVQLHRPHMVINAAAYTAVDQAESAATGCFAINAEAPTVLAQACAEARAVLVHFSTDYVFDGSKTTPYMEDDAPAPLNVYGASKLAGEQGVAAAGGAWLIVRTSWIYTAGGRNFMETIRRLARERDDLSVVIDQVGAPTTARAVARGVATMLESLWNAPDPYVEGSALAGTYHMSAGGSTTWYDFARRILSDDPRSSEHRVRSVTRLTSDEYGAPARRPAWSVLDNARLAERFGVRLPHWNDLWLEERRFLV